jgi:hypothetical protein
MKSVKRAKANESLFLLCDQCLWEVTCLNKKYLEDLAEISIRAQLSFMQARTVIKLSNKA